MLRPIPSAHLPGLNILSSSSSSSSTLDPSCAGLSAISPPPTTGAASRARPNGDTFLIEGPIAPKYFLPQTWAHQLQDSLGKHRYATFVCLMISRIRAENSDGEEVRRFFALLDTSDGKDDFMEPVEEHLPELEMALIFRWMSLFSDGGLGLIALGRSDASSPHGARSHSMALLLDLVRPAIRERKAKTEAVAKAIEGATITWENGLSEKEKDKISLLMFGKDGPGKSEKTSRLLKSTIELGFPQAVLTYTALDMQDSELPIFRDYDGLPVDLHSHEPSRSPSPSFSETEVPMLLDESHTVKEIEEIQCYDRRLKRKHGPKIVEEDKTASDLLVTENAAAQEGWIDMRALEGEPRTKDDKLCSGIAKVDVQAPTTVRLLDLDDLEGRNAEKCESGQDSGGSFVSNPWAEEDVACARRFAFGTPYPENQWADTASSCRDAEVGKP